MVVVVISVLLLLLSRLFNSIDVNDLLCVRMGGSRLRFLVAVFMAVHVDDFGVINQVCGCRLHKRIRILGHGDALDKWLQVPELQRWHLVFPGIRPDQLVVHREAKVFLGGS